MYHNRTVLTATVPPMPLGPFRYRSHDDDSGRWTGFAFRVGDIVISTRSKSGTTWMQMICALLILQTTELPARLTELSPWLDFLGTPLDSVVARLDSQQHRRFIKTHTPLDGIPLDPRATYIVVARNPLDAAVSAYHQGHNLDRERMRELTGQAQPTTTSLSEHAWLLAWIDADPDPREHLDSLPGFAHHLSDAWTRRDEPNVFLVHYQDLTDDLEGEMRRIAEQLGIEVSASLWPTLVSAARFDAMQTRAETLAPDPADILVDHAKFFRRGKSGSGRALLSAAELAQYDDRAKALMPAEMVAWLHRSTADERAD